MACHSFVASPQPKLSQDINQTWSGFSCAVGSRIARNPGSRIAWNSDLRSALNKHVHDVPPFDFLRSFDSPLSVCFTFPHLQCFKSFEHPNESSKPPKKRPPDASNDQQTKSRGHSQTYVKKRGATIEIDPNQFLHQKSDFVVLASLLRRYGETKAISEGMSLHYHISKCGYDQDTFIRNCLIQMYGACGRMEIAQEVFDNMDKPNLYSWNILINAFVRNGRLDDAKSVFGQMPDRNVASWNAIIAACVQNGQGKKALHYFYQMQLEDFEADKITFISALDACASMANLQAGLYVHSAIAKNRLEEENAVGNAIVHMYGKCGNLHDARCAFSHLREQNVVSWSTMIAACTQNGYCKEGLELFGQMKLACVQPNQITYVCVLDACGSLAVLGEGQKMHAAIISDGYEKDTVVGNALINMYSKCQSLHDARSVFRRMLQKNIVSWSSMITACTHNGHSKEALNYFQQMHLYDSRPDKITFVCALNACTSSASMEVGQEIHASIVDQGYDGDIIVGTALINMYGKCRSLQGARNVFGRMPKQDVVSWSAMIAIYAQNGWGENALNYFYQMQLRGFQPNQVTCACALDACASLLNIKKGKLVHSTVVDNVYEHNVIVGTAMVTMYGKCGSLRDAMSVFGRIAQRNLVAWSAIIAACVLNGHDREALQFFLEMLDDGFKPDQITFTCALDACGNLPSIEEGQWIHAAIFDNQFVQDVIVGNALINMYGNCGSLQDARSVFGQMEQLNLGSWNVMIAVCSQNDCSEEALYLFHQMQVYGFQPDAITFVSSLDACASLTNLEEGEEIHSAIIESGFEQDTTIKNALINMYGKCGSLHSAIRVFEQMIQRDVVSWNAIISRCAQNGHGIEALDLFYQMQHDCVSPDKITLLAVLTACGHVGQVQDGKHFFHSLSQQYGIILTAEHYASMIDLLGRAGLLDEAEDLLNTMPFVEEVASAGLSLLGACRIHGDVERGERAARYLMKLDQGDITPYVMLSNIYATAGR